VLYGSLVKAVQREAPCAVAAAWGVGGSTVWLWRRALGVTWTKGDSLRITAQNKSPIGKKAIKAMAAKARPGSYREDSGQQARQAPAPSRDRGNA